MNKQSIIYIAEHNGMVGSAILRELQQNKNYLFINYTTYPQYIKRLTRKQIVNKFEK